MQAVQLVKTTEQAESVSEFFRTIWSDGPEVVPFDLILAAVHVGSYCSFVADSEQVVAASFGLLGRFREQTVLHSHVTASVRPGAGFDIKLHQRDWAKANGIQAITWTFDPLVRRNCYFNFVKLGASAVEYLPDFYGTMTDSINAGDKSDRLLALWNLSGGSQVPTASEGQVQIELPEDIESLRQSDLASARIWREQVADQLAPLLANGWSVTGVTDDKQKIIVTPPQNRKSNDK
jgi:predicted GNAT superfamily acetyltransferase